MIWSSGVESRHAGWVNPERLFGQMQPGRNGLRGRLIVRTQSAAMTHPRTSRISARPAPYFQQ